MKFRDPETGEFKELYVKAADTLPVGTEVDYEGEEVPAGWEVVYDEDKKSFAQMRNGTVIDISSKQIVTGWGNSNIDVGDFYCEPTNNRIIIPANSAEYIELYGSICGTGNCSAYVSLLDENANLIEELTILHQYSGNSYEAFPIGKKIVKIPDTSKNHYIQLTINGYNDVHFKLNDGFNGQHTFIGVRKIK